MTTTDADIFTINEIAFLYQVGPSEVRRWIKEGKLRTSRDGDHMCIRREDLLAFDPEALSPHSGPPVRSETTQAQRDAIMKDYDPEKVRRAFEKLQGLLEGVDTKQLKADLRAQRGQDSKGRPGD